MSPLVVDVVLGGAVVWLAWMSLASRDLFRSVILFIVFGLLMALTWVRLEAPDIALAEAAIGAGLTGALLLDAAAQFTRHGAAVPAAGEPAPASPAPAVDGGEEGATRGSLVLGGLAVLALGGMLVFALLRLPSGTEGLTGQVAEELPRSGVEHPVTAVLLNFRAFDTWLEVSVLLLAALAALIVRRSRGVGDAAEPRAADPVLAALPSVLVPLMVLAAGYLLWLGSHAPGGAFQAGAVLASAAVLLLLAGRRSITALGGASLRLALVLGVLAFLAAALATLLGGSLLLELPPARAGTAILLIEAAVALSIGATLAVLFAAARPVPSSGYGSRGEAAPP